MCYDRTFHHLQATCLTVNFYVKFPDNVVPDNGKFLVVQICRPSAEIFVVFICAA